MPERHQPIPQEPAEEVAETEAWCQTCSATRTFTQTRKDLSDLEAAIDASPNVHRALRGEPGWECAVCHGFRRDLVTEQAYPVAFANVGAVRTERRELPTGGEGVSEDPGLRAEEVAGEGALHEPATEATELHVAVQADATLGATRLEDRLHREVVLRDLAAQERGDVAFAVPAGPRKEMPIPERLPPREERDAREREDADERGRAAKGPGRKV